MKIVMKSLAYLPLGIVCAWGLWCSIQTASSNPSKIMGEGLFVLIIALAPALLVGLIHSALCSSNKLWPLLYSAASGAIFAAVCIAYWSNFGFGLLQTILGPAVVAFIFGGTFVLFRSASGIRTIHQDEALSETELSGDP